ncbi:MAG: oligosaccharide flippase family protein [Nitrospiraceae bacterium]
MTAQQRPIPHTEGLPPSLDIPPRTSVAQWGLEAILRDTAVVFVGRVGGAGFGFVMSWAVARWMGPETFGLYSLFIVMLILGNDVLGDGLNPGVVRDYMRHRQTGPFYGSDVLSTALVLRLILGFPMVAGGIAVAVWGTRLPAHYATYTGPVALGLIGSLGATLLSFALAVWQARQEFVPYGLLAAAVNTLRVASAILLAAVGAFSLNAVMGLHVFFYYLCAGIALWLLWPKLAGLRITRGLLKDLMHFGKWPAIASLCFVLQSNLAVPALTYSVNPGEAGLYAAGASLLLLIDFITVSLLTTLLPRVSQLQTQEQWRAYVKRFSPLFLLMAIGLLPFIFIVRPLIEWLFGPAYSGTVPVLQVLFFGGLGTLLTHPLYPVLYAMNRPQLFSLTQVCALLGWLLAAWWLIPRYGAVGAAWTTLLARLLQTAFIMVVVTYVLDLRRIVPTPGDPIDNEAHAQ